MKKILTFLVGTLILVPMMASAQYTKDSLVQKSPTYYMYQSAKLKNIGISVNIGTALVGGAFFIPPRKKDDGVIINGKNQAEQYQQRMIIGGVIMGIGTVTNIVLHIVANEKMKKASLGFADEGIGIKIKL